MWRELNLRAVSLLFIPLEFTANHSLETCLELLSKQQTALSWRDRLLSKPDLTFSFIPVGSYQSEFTIRRRQARFEVRAHGRLQKLTGDSTLVAGTVGFSASMFLGLLPLLAVVIIGTVIEIIDFVGYGRCFMGIIALFFTAIVVLNVATLRKYNVELAHLIKESLK